MRPFRRPRLIFPTLIVIVPMLAIMTLALIGALDLL
jgi:hypothetical protein